MSRRVRTTSGGFRSGGFNNLVLAAAAAALLWLAASGRSAGMGQAHDHAHPGPSPDEADTRLTVRVDERGRLLTLDLGPIDLPAGHGHAMARTPLQAVELPFPTLLTGFDVELLDTAGDPLPQAFLHHVNIMAPDRTDLFRPIMQRLVAAGEETGAMVVPWPFAIPAGQGQRILAYAMLHNPTQRDLGPVTLRMRVRYRDRWRRAVQPFFIDVQPPPGPASWDLPPGPSTRSWEGSPQVAGRILGIGGHLHRFGTELVLEDVTAGTVLARLAAETLPDGTVLAVGRKRFFWRFGLPLHPDRTYRITAVYDNPTGDTIPDGAMGAIGGIFMPRTRHWPAPDTTHPHFVRDLDGLLDPVDMHHP